MEVTTRVFDIENDNALVSEKTVIDTIEAEDLDTGDDSPASFINKPGSSFCFCTITILGIAARLLRDGGQRRFSVFGASQRNQLPVIPTFAGDFQPVSTGFNRDFRLRSPMINSLIPVPSGHPEWRGSPQPTASRYGRGQVTHRGFGRVRANQTYHAVLSVEDSEGESETRDCFDTLDKASFVIEVEDYNFNAGEYLDEPVVIPELDEDNMLNWMTTHTLPRRAIWTSITSTRMKSSICHTPVSS